MSGQRIKELGLSRVARPRWNIYEPDGLGRDTYISYNNGGFWNMPRAKPYVPSYNYYTPKYHTLFHRAAPFRYICDGSGRDNYIIHNDGGLRETFIPLDTYKLKDFLRKNEDEIRLTRPVHKTKGEIFMDKKLKKIENDLVNRLYRSNTIEHGYNKHYQIDAQNKSSNIKSINNNFKDIDEAKHFKTLTNFENKGKLKKNKFLNIKTEYSTLPDPNFDKKPRSKSSNENLIKYYSLIDPNEEQGMIPGLRFYPKNTNTVINDNPTLNCSLNYYKPYTIPKVILPKPRYFSNKKKLRLNNLDYGINNYKSSLKTKLIDNKKQFNTASNYVKKPFTTFRFADEINNNENEKQC